MLQRKNGLVLMKMKILNKGMLVALLVLVLFSLGCASQEERQQKYNECTATCAVVVEGSDEEALVTLEICRKECEERYLS